MLYLDGLLLKDRDDLRFRTDGRAPIDEFTLVTFFGGQSDDYRPAKDEYIDLDNIRVSQNATFVFDTLATGTPVSAMSITSGDFNQDAIVNLADYAVWRDGQGGAYTNADYALWKSNLGNQYANLSQENLSGANVVPEPACIWSVPMAAGNLWLLYRRAKRAGQRR